MSSLKNINFRPKLIPYLISGNSFSQKPLVVVDVGSRGGYERHWNLFYNQIKILGFDPDAKECQRLVRQLKNSNISYYPYALWQNIGYKNFYMMSNLPSSSFFKPNYKFWERFPDEVNLKIKKIVKVQTTTLDSFTKMSKIPYVDFMKLDIEGAELAALKGAKKLLQESIIGVTCEIAFDQLLENGPIFNEIDAYLKSFGFRLFDIGLLRKSLKTLSSNPSLTQSGQVIAGHALYFRDATAEMNSGEIKKWGEIKILKLASLFELFGLPDCSIELVETANEKNLFTNFESKSLIKLLIPNGKTRLIDILKSSILNKNFRR